MNSEKMLEALLEVRDSAQCNVFDTKGVCEVMSAYGYFDEALAWKELPAQQKMSLLQETGRLIEARKKEASSARLKKHKATIYVNRHVTKKNLKQSRTNGVVVDEAAITIKTSFGKIRAKKIEIKGEATIIQDASKPICSGATIWLETKLEDLVIDGTVGSRELFSK